MGFRSTRNRYIILYNEYYLYFTNLFLFIAPPDKRNGFSIVNTDKESDVTQVVIIASSPEEKAECVELVNSAIGSLV